MASDADGQDVWSLSEACRTYHMPSLSRSVVLRDERHDVVSQLATRAEDSIGRLEFCNILDELVVERNVVLAADVIQQGIGYT